MKKITIKIHTLVLSAVVAVTASGCSGGGNVALPMDKPNTSQTEAYSAYTNVQSGTTSQTPEATSVTSVPEVPTVSFEADDRSTVIKPCADGTLEISRRTRTSSQPMGRDGTWTVFVYMCGSDLEEEDSTGTFDMYEMIESSTSDNVRFVVQTGGCKKWHDFGISADNTERFEIVGGKIYRVDSLKKANMGNPDTLSDFLSWGVKNYPAENMGVILWDHGSGSIGGVCFDMLYEKDSLSLSELDEAFTDVYSKMTDKFTFIGFDACLMATIETANVLVPHAEYMIASQELIPGYGWNYTAIGEALTKNPGISGEQLGKIICDSYYKDCEAIGEGDNCTLSVTDLSKLDSVIRAMNADCEKMNASAADSGELSAMLRKIIGAKNFGGNNEIEGYTNMVDLGSMFSGACPTGKTSAAVKNAVVYNVYGANMTGATGLSTYYPLSVTGSETLKIFSDICVSPGYMNFIDRVTYGRSNGGSFDNYSGDDFWSYGNDDYWNNDSYNDDYFDFWSYFDEESDGHDFAGNDSTLYYATQPHINEEGIYTFTLDEDSMYYLNAVNCCVYMYDAESGEMVYLGSDNYVDVNWDTGVVTDLFDGTWFSLGNGSYIAMTIIEQGYDYDIYTAPVFLNGKDTNLRIKCDYTGEMAEFYILGAWDGITAEGEADKGITQLEKGDLIVPIYESYDADGNYLGYYEGDAYSYTGINEDITYWLLPEADYLYSFEMQDIFGDYYYTDFVTFAVDEEGNIFYYED